MFWVWLEWAVLMGLPLLLLETRELRLLLDVRFRIGYCWDKVTERRLWCFSTEGAPSEKMLNIQGFVGVRRKMGKSKPVCLRAEGSPHRIISIYSYLSLVGIRRRGRGGGLTKYPFSLITIVHNTHMQAPH